MGFLLLLLSFLVQLLGAFYALRLIKLASKPLIWGLIASGFLCMAFLQGMELHLHGFDGINAILNQQMLRLLLSILFMAGTFRLQPLLQDFQAQKIRANESEQRFRMLSENSLTGIYIVQNGRFAYVNPALEQMAGYAPNELLGKPFDLVIDPVDSSKVQNIVRQRMEKKPKGNKSAFRCRKKDGNILHVEVLGIRTEFLGQPAMIGNVVDVTTRVLVENALHTERQFMRTMLENMADGVLACNQQGILVQVNRAARNWCPLHEEMSSLIRDFPLLNSNGEPFADPKIHPLHRALAGEHLRQEEFTLPGVDGDLRHFIANGDPLLNENEKLGAVLVLHDITELRAAEAQVRSMNAQLEQRVQERTRQLQLLHRAMENSPTSVMILDSHGIIEYVNPKFCSSSGYSNDEILGKYPDFLRSGVQSEGFFQEMIRTVRQGHTWHGDICNQKRNGELYWVSESIAPVFDEQGHIIHNISVSEDITQRKKMQEKLQEAQRLANTALELTQTGYWYVSLENRDEFVSNPRTAQIFGHAPTPEFRYRVKEDWYVHLMAVDVQIAETTDQHFKEVMNGKARTYDCSYPFRRPDDGRIIWIHALAYLVRDDSNRPSGMYGVVQDITVQKRMESEILRAKEKAESASKAKGMFLANMSHEIRTPLNAILGFSQILQRSAQLSPQHQSYLETINKSGEHLLSLINDVLEMSKIEAGRVVILPEAFILDAFIQEIHNLFRLRAEAKNLQFAIHGIERLPPFLSADRNKIRQILVNLIGNALKFTSQGGISLNLWSEASTGDDVLLYFEVRDTGSGITPEDAERLFQQFEQAEAGKNMGGGTGLGLAISRQLARLMGGDISLQSEIDVGSSFTLSVKAQKLALVPKDSSTNHLELPVGLRPGQRSPRILVADDQQESLDLIEQMLNPLSFEIRMVSNGQEVLEALPSFAPDLILLDLRMPVLDGQATLCQIRASAQPQPRIIIVSASAFDEVRQQALDNGADDFLGKPFQETLLLEKIGKALELEYVYTAPHGKSAQTADVSAAELKEIPKELRSKIHHAAIMGDFDQLEYLFSEIPSQQANLAESLRTLAQTFNSTRLLELFPE
ncbi:MAG TPA: PAS domain S-box protein [Fibrobacteraceae bacterium]|nr:PAS domain S-box protein [Fibrobacteraceae bacterium]